MGFSNDPWYILIKDEVISIWNHAQSIKDRVTIDQQVCNTSTNIISLNISATQSLEKFPSLLKLPYAQGAAYNDRIWEHEEECIRGIWKELLQ